MAPDPEGGQEPWHRTDFHQLFLMRVLTVHVLKCLSGPSSSAAAPGRRGQGGGLRGAWRGELLGNPPAAGRRCR